MSLGTKTILRATDAKVSACRDLVAHLIDLMGRSMDEADRSKIYALHDQFMGAAIEERVVISGAPARGVFRAMGLDQPDFCAVMTLQEMAS